MQRPPHSVGIFSRQEAQLITQYALETYYRHFKLYRYAFTMRHIKQMEVRTSWLELPCDAFPSLADGVPSDLEPPEPEPPAPAPAIEVRRRPCREVSPGLISPRPAPTRRRPPPTSVRAVATDPAASSCRGPSHPALPHHLALPATSQMPPIELDANVPDDVKKAVEEQIAAQVAAMRAQLEQEYADRISRHENKIVELESKLGVEY